MNVGVLLRMDTNMEKKKNVANTDQMIFLNSSMLCFHDNCQKHASFGFEDKKVEYCLTHKLKDMINLKQKSRKKCIEKACARIPRFNFDHNQQGIYCSLHKKNEMIDVISKKSSGCMDPNCCIVKALYNFSNQSIGVYC